MRSPRSVFALSVLLSWFVLGEGAQAQGGPGQAPPPVTVAKPVVKDIIERTDFIGRFEAIDQVPTVTFSNRRNRPSPPRRSGWNSRRAISTAPSSCAARATSPTSSSTSAVRPS